MTQSSKICAKPILANHSQVKKKKYFRRYVLSGYRYPPPTFVQSFISMFQVHNESFNVWSHLIACVWFIYLFFTCVVDVEYWGSRIDLCVVLFGIVGQISCFTLSTIYHLFSNMSEAWNERLLYFDLIGIMSLIVTSYVSGLYFGFKCRPFAQKSYSLISCSLFLISLLTIRLQHNTRALATKINLTKVAPQVAAMCVTVLFGLVPLSHYIYGGPLEDPARDGTESGIKNHRAFFLKYFSKIHWSTVSWALRMFFFYFVGFFFWKTKIPERFSPGSFDLFTSHGIWHICVFFAALCWQKAVFIFNDNPYQCPINENFS